jgi:hypothetical protein
MVEIARGHHSGSVWTSMPRYPPAKIAAAVGGALALHVVVFWVSFLTAPGKPKEGQKESLYKTDTATELVAPEPGKGSGKAEAKNGASQSPRAGEAPPGRKPEAGAEEKEASAPEKSTATERPPEAAKDVPPPTMPNLTGLEDVGK